MHLPIYEITLKKTRSIFNRYEIRYDGTPHSVLPLLRRYLATVDREHYIVLLLDTQNRVTGINTVGIGTLTSVQISPREIFKPAILGNAYGIICCHNHPSGVSNPSEADTSTYKLLNDASKSLGIIILDDIIICEDGSYYSFQETANRDTRKQLKQQRIKAVSAAKKRLCRGVGCRRDTVLLAADRLGELAGMIRTEAQSLLIQIIEDLKPIVTTTARIRRATRKRASNLLELAIEMQDTGNYINFKKFADADTEEKPTTKSCSIPLADFIEIPVDKKRRSRK